MAYFHKVFDNKYHHFFLRNSCRLWCVNIFLPGRFREFITFHYSSLCEFLYLCVSYIVCFPLLINIVFKLYKNEFRELYKFLFSLALEDLSGQSYNYANLIPFTKLRPIAERTAFKKIVKVINVCRGLLKDYSTMESIYRHEYMSGLNSK